MWRGSALQQELMETEWLQLSIQLFWKHSPWFIHVRLKTCASTHKSHGFLMSCALLLKPLYISFIYRTFMTPLYTKYATILSKLTTIPCFALQGHEGWLRSENSSWRSNYCLSLFDASGVRPTYLPTLRQFWERCKEKPISCWQGKTQPSRRREGSSKRWDWWDEWKTG